jgi:hypothetical protein
VFERLFDVIIKFGFCDLFPNKSFTHLLGNSNNANMTPLDDYNKYVKQKVFNGKKLDHLTYQ